MIVSLSDSERVERQRDLLLKELVSLRKVAREFDDRLARLEELVALGATSTRALVLDFVVGWERRTGDRYVENWSRDLGTMRRLLRSLAAEELRRRMGRFFGLTDSFVQRQGYSLGAFAQMVATLGAVAAPGPTTSRAVAMHRELAETGFFDEGQHD